MYLGYRCVVRLIILRRYYPVVFNFIYGDNFISSYLRSENDVKIKPKFSIYFWVVDDVFFELNFFLFR